jgi:Ca-activated chloride channel family protein
MGGEKITAARNSLMQFINLLDERDRLEVIVFNTDIITLTELSPVGEKRQNVLNRVSGIVEGGGTRLYDAVLEAYQGLENSGDPNHIRSVVVLSDGEDTESLNYLSDVLNQIGATGEEAGSSIKLFTIAFGEDADKDILKQIAEPTGGKQYDSDPKTINKVYGEIATFF